MLEGISEGEIFLRPMWGITTVAPPCTLQGGTPQKLVVEASNMTMMIYTVDDTYFCGVGLKPGTELKEASQKLSLVREAFKKAIAK
ncbi:MAG TPA: hypothetical protein PLM53_19850 [Spirochaetota bacterium]|nr:hypothetical protein [Spirochaetota bacterium]HQF10203.1 hypothetical protein [Spirochaetota bacterium]HQH99349.1 hypothetical protein [Spirochaetota bacterium]